MDALILLDTTRRSCCSPDAPALDDERRQQLERQAWPRRASCTRRCWPNLPRECFPTANCSADNRDTQIVGERLALAGKMLLTSNMRTIEHIRLSDNGARFGSSPSPWSSRPMTSLLRWTRSPPAGERWIQAGMLASRPAQGRHQRRAGDPSDGQTSGPW